MTGTTKMAHPVRVTALLTALCAVTVVVVGCGKPAPPAELKVEVETAPGAAPAASAVAEPAAGTAEDRSSVDVAATADTAAPAEAVKAAGAKGLYVALVLHKPGAADLRGMASTVKSLAEASGKAECIVAETANAGLAGLFKLLKLDPDTMPTPATLVLSTNGIVTGVFTIPPTKERFAEALLPAQPLAVRSALRDGKKVILVLPKSTTVDNYYRADVQTEGSTIPEEYVDRLLLAKKDAGLEGVDNLSPKLNAKVTINGKEFLLTGILPKNEFAAKAAWSGGVFDTPVSCAPNRKSLVSFSEAERFRRKPINDLGTNQCLVGAELAELRRKQIGFLFQTFNLIPYLTAEQNVMAPLMLAKLPTDRQRVRATELLGRVGLGDRLDHKPSELSVGQQQRVALARMMANDPALILADEPTGNLDPQTAADALAFLGSLCKDAGKTIVMVTHSMDAAKKAGRLLRCTNGLITEA